jgi:CBS-domain-containing membrane protein
MKRKVVSVPASASVQEAAQVLVEKRVGTLPVIDEQTVIIGVVRISDMLKIFMPDFVSLAEGARHSGGARGVANASGFTRCRVSKTYSKGA